MHRHKHIQLICSVVFSMYGVIILISGCAARTQQAAKHPTVTLTKYDTREIAAGTEINTVITTQCSIYTHPHIQTYVSDVGRRLVPYVKRNSLPYRITILQDERIYATAAPGGFIYLTTGMLTFVDNEAELAAVIAHELARVQPRDWRLSDSKKIVDVLAQGGTAVGPLFGNCGALAAMGLQALASMQSVEPSAKKAAMAADKRAMLYMTKAGYDPQCYLDVIMRLINSDGYELPMAYHYLISHPIDYERLSHMNNYFKKLPLSGKSFVVNHEHYRDMIATLQTH